MPSLALLLYDFRNLATSSVLPGMICQVEAEYTISFSPGDKYVSASTELGLLSYYKEATSVLFHSTCGPVPFPFHMLNMVRQPLPGQWCHLLESANVDHNYEPIVFL